VVVAIGPNVRQVAITDCVLFDPEDRAEVELQSTTFILPRERDLHAIAARPSGDDRTGLYI
jgi:chaperonin GroES